MHNVLSRLPSSSDILLLVVRGGSGLSADDPYNSQVDYHTLTGTIDEVLQTHYQYAVGRVATHLVSCPNITSNTYDMLSSLTPGNGNYGDGPQATPSQSFPISVLPLLTVEHPQYKDSLLHLTHSANSIYHDFLDSEEGVNFNGNICFLADGFGSIMLYDILARPHSHACNLSSSPKTTPTKEHKSKKHSHSFTVSGQHDPAPSDDSASIVLDLGVVPQSFVFDVSSVFAMGSPLSLVLSMRKARGEEGER